MLNSQSKKHWHNSHRQASGSKSHFAMCIFIKVRGKKTLFRKQCILEVCYYKIITISTSISDFTHHVGLCNKNQMKSHHTSSNDSSKTQSKLHYQAQNKMLMIPLFGGIMQLYLCVICINCIKGMWRESVGIFTAKLVKKCYTVWHWRIAVISVERN
jgi:hypothetical protein